MFLHRKTRKQLSAQRREERDRRECEAAAGPATGATDSDGDVAWYSNQGANLLVTASSSGDAFFNAGVATTDLPGSPGYTLGDYTGDDKLWVGEGSDVFSFEDGFGLDTIYDFRTASACGPTSDVVDFRGLGEVCDFDQVMAAMTNGCGRVVYDLDDDGENVIVFRGLSVSDFSASDFLFV